MTNVILRFPEVIARTGLSQSSIYQRMKEGTFPSSIKLGNRGRSIGWLEQEISGWIEERISDSRDK